MNYNQTLKEYHNRIETNCVRRIEEYLEAPLVFEYYQYWKTLNREGIIENMLHELKKSFDVFWTNPKFNTADISIIFLEWGGISSGWGVEAYGCKNDTIGIKTTEFYPQYEDYESDNNFNTIPTFTLPPLQKLCMEYELFNDKDSEYTVVFDLLVQTSYLLAFETFVKFNEDTQFKGFKLKKPFRIAIGEHDTGNLTPLLILI